MITMFVYDLTPEHLAQSINWGVCDPEEVDWVRYLSACYNRDKYNFFELWDVNIIHGFLNMIKNFYCEELEYSLRSKTKEAILKHQLKWLERDYLPYRHPEANGDEKRELAQWYNSKFQSELAMLIFKQHGYKSITDVETSPQPGTQKQVSPTCFDTPQVRQIFQNAVNGGLLTPDEYKPTKDASNGLLAIFANELGKILKIGDYYSKCEVLWGKRNLAQYWQKVSAQKNYDKLEAEIKRYFNTEQNSNNDKDT